MAAAGVQTNTRSTAPSGSSSIVGDGLHAEHLLALQVGAEDPARVARGEQVVQGDEAELAGVRRRAGDDDAPGSNRALELLGGRARARRRRPAASGLAELDQRVDRDRRAVGGRRSAG